MVAARLAVNNNDSQVVEAEVAFVQVALSSVEVQQPVVVASLVEEQMRQA